MPFSSKQEENNYKKWLKTSPYGASAQEFFGFNEASQESILEIYRQEKENTKAKVFLPFNKVYGDSFISKLPKELSEEQQKFLAALKWEFILQKIEPMNKLLEKAYNLLDKEKVADAMKLLQNIADVGHPEACYLVAAYALQGSIEEKRYDLAFNYANKAIEFVAHPRSYLILAGLYYQGFGVGIDRKKAISYVLQAERSAESDPSVYVILAEYYQDGYMVHRDGEKVAPYSHKAAQHGG